MPGLPRAEPAPLPQGTGPPLQGLPGQRIADTVRAATELSSASQGEAADISTHCPENVEPRPQRPCKSEAASAHRRDDQGKEDDLGDERRASRSGGGAAVTVCGGKPMSQEPSCQENAAEERRLVIVVVIIIFRIIAGGSADRFGSSSSWSCQCYHHADISAIQYSSGPSETGNQSFRGLGTVAPRNWFAER